MKSSIRLFRALLQYECFIYLRNPSQIVNPLLFFFLIISLFPMGMSIELAMLQKIAPGLVWISFLLASLLNIDRLFYFDYCSGLLEHKILSPISMLMRIYVKLIVHWFLTTLPLILICPLLGLMYGLSVDVDCSLMLSLVFGTPIITVLIVLLASVVLGAGNRSSLISLVFFPLTIPVLIFGSGSVLMTMQGLDPQPIRFLLLGLDLIFLTLGPFLIKKCLILSVE